MVYWSAQQKSSEILNNGDLQSIIYWYLVIHKLFKKILNQQFDSYFIGKVFILEVL